MRGRLGAIASAASMTGRGSLPLARAGCGLSWLAVAGQTGILPERSNAAWVSRMASTSVAGTRVTSSDKILRFALRVKTRPRRVRDELQASAKRRVLL